jgi:uncharacterized RDD family membrane protein YckC
MSLASNPLTMSTPIHMVARAGLGRRLVALLIDILVLSLIDAIVNSVFGVTHAAGAWTIVLVGGGVNSYATVTTADWPWLVLVWISYYAILEGLFGATAGKALMRLRVTDLEGRRVSRQEVVLRNVIRPVDALPGVYLVGGALTLLTRTHQRLGDRLAGTVVLPVDAVTSPPLPRPALRTRLAGLALLVAILLAYSSWFVYNARPPLVIEGAQSSVGIFNQGAGTYSLGSPQWGNGTISYPISYEIARTGQSCSGQVTLDWTGFPQGWIISGGEDRCSPRVYP